MPGAPGLLIVGVLPIRNLIAEPDGSPRWIDAADGLNESSLALSAAIWRDAATDCFTKCPNPHPNPCGFDPYLFAFCGTCPLRIAADHLGSIRAAPARA